MHTTFTDLQKPTNHKSQPNWTNRTCQKNLPITKLLSEIFFLQPIWLSQIKEQCHVMSRTIFCGFLILFWFKIFFPEKPHCMCFLTYSTELMPFYEVSTVLHVRTGNTIYTCGLPPYWISHRTQLILVSGHGWTKFLWRDIYWELTPYGLIHFVHEKKSSAQTIYLGKKQYKIEPLSGTYLKCKTRDSAGSSVMIFLMLDL